MLLNGPNVAKLNPLGFWLVFGHCRNSQRERARDLVRTDTVAALPSPLADVKTPSDAIDRFSRECVRPALGKRVRASAMTAVWEQWCADRGGPSLSPTLFGRLAGERRRKERIGGHYWYMDVQLIAYGLQVAVDNTAASARLQAAQSAA